MNFIKKYFGVLAGTFTIIVSFVFKSNSTLTDIIYGKGVYPIIRKVLDLILYFFPFSLLLLFIIFVLVVLFFRIKKNRLTGLLNIIGWMIAAFYWMWGFNYFKSPLSEKINLEVVSIDADQREILIQSTLRHAIDLSNRITKYDSINSNHIDQEIITACGNMASQIVGITTSKTSPVAMFPGSVFLRIGITGMYFPFTGQAHYEPLLGPISKPFTMAHEWFHAAGIAPESEANFLAYISLINSTRDDLQYAAEMNLLIELLIFYKLTDYEKYLFYRGQFSPKMDFDLKERNALYQKYINVVSKKSDVVINQYLKMQNQAGVSDYHRLADWVVSWESNKKLSP